MKGDGRDEVGFAGDGVGDGAADGDGSDDDNTDCGFGDGEAPIAVLACLGFGVDGAAAGLAC